MSRNIKRYHATKKYKQSYKKAFISRILTNSFSVSCWDSCVSSEDSSWEVCPEHRTIKRPSMISPDSISELAMVLGPVNCPGHRTLSCGESGNLVNTVYLTVLWLFYKLICPALTSVNGLYRVSYWAKHIYFADAEIGAQTSGLLHVQ